MKTLAFLTPSMWAALRFDPPPEPVALLLLGTALILIGKILRRWETPDRVISSTAAEEGCSMLSVAPANSPGGLEPEDNTVVSVFDVNSYVQANRSHHAGF